MTDSGPRGPSMRGVPEGDNRERMICADCGFVLYDNPKIVVGSVARWGDRILLCRRSINPRRGYGDMPLIVLTAGRRDPPPDAPADMREQVPLFYREAGRAHEAYAELSTRGHDQLIPDSGHNIPAEKPEAVMREMLRPDATSVRPVRTEGQVMPDGSVRYGSESAGMTVTLRNPCPPGDIEHEMMALRSLPGRGRK